MGVLKKALVAGALGAAVLAPVVPASAAGGTCNGTYDTNCSYCSYQGGSTANPPSACTGGFPGFRWEFCSVFVAGACYVG
ncbi:MAG TPA: hypothetical protein VF519_05770 [Mycobacteriales bacterium]|jgi:biotin synthase-related radical SAM superfamily protein